MNIEEDLLKKEEEIEALMKEFQTKKKDLNVLRNRIKKKEEKLEDLHHKMNLLTFETETLRFVLKYQIDEEKFSSFLKKLKKEYGNGILHINVVTPYKFYYYSHYPKKSTEVAIPGRIPYYFCTNCGRFLYGYPKKEKYKKESYLPGYFLDGIVYRCNKCNIEIARDIIK